MQLLSNRFQTSDKVATGDSFILLSAQSEIKQERDREKARELQLQMNDGGTALS